MRGASGDGELVRPSRLSGLAKASIVSRINAGEIVVGRIYSVPSIAEALGVSVTPVREAMLDLAAEGIVEAVPNRGFRVIELTPQDLDEIFELRLMLEVPATSGLATRDLPDGVLEGFDRLAEEIEHSAEKGDAARFLETDRAFHLALLEASGNRRLVELVSRLRDQTRLVGVERLAREGNLRSSAGEHRAIVEAIRAGDAAGVSALVSGHLRHTRGIWAGVDEHATS
jgi:DNA-binding GntR family transcriptional regulator